MGPERLRPSQAPGQCRCLGPETTLEYGGAGGAVETHQAKSPEGPQLCPRVAPCPPRPTHSPQDPALACSGERAACPGGLYEEGFRAWAWGLKPASTTYRATCRSSPVLGVLPCETRMVTLLGDNSTGNGSSPVAAT